MEFNPLAMVREVAGFLRNNRTGAALARRSIASLALKLLHAVLTVVVAVLLARALGPAQFGVYAFAFAVTTVLAIPVQFGLPMLVVREIAAGRARSDAAAIQGIWRFSLRFVLVGSALVILAAAIALALGWGQLASASRWTFLWTLTLVPLLALGALYGAALRGFDRVVLGQLPDHVLRLAIFATSILTILAWGGELTAPRAMGLHVNAAALALLAAYAFLDRVHSVRSIGGEADPARFRRWMLATMPLGFIAAAQIVNTRADTLLLGIFSGAESVGLYQVAVQGAQAVALALGAINLVVAPRFAQLHQQGDTANLQRLVTLSARAVVLMAVPVVLILIIFGGWIIRWAFGAGYQSAHLPLAILVVGQLANAGFGSVGVLLNMTGHERATARGLALAAGLNLVLNFALIPSFGVNGAAAATAISLLLWNVMLWQSARLLIGIDTLALR